MSRDICFSHSSRHAYLLAGNILLGNYFLILSGTVRHGEKICKSFLVGMTTNFLFFLALYSTWRENKHIKSLQVKMTTTIFSFFLALYLARTENLHIISSSTNIYIMKTCPKSCTSSLFGTHKKPICNFAFQIRMTTIRHG